MKFEKKCTNKGKFLKFIHFQKFTERQILSSSGTSSEEDDAPLSSVQKVTLDTGLYLQKHV